ncbi:head-tail adaptor protein [Sinorhizobium meliloti]|uniref:head-tail adaptor protein n=1 Tax=Rhizobium meliloti TaxID=382 RepID=UPI00299D2D09|nr:head-tail adaptor protein [Sinorhizobium meliloti]MDX0084233.1 head-tail adaptor protein [Sinorhizobium meliloti]
MAKKPSAGRMHQRLHFQKRPEGEDEYGNPQSGPYETVFTAAAELIPLRGGEPVQAARLVGVQPYTVRIRSCAAAREVTPSWRIVNARNASRVMNIRTVTNPDQKNAWLDLLVDDGVAT